MDRVSLGALRLDPVALSDIPSILLRFIEAGRAHHIVTVNLQFLGIAAGDVQFADMVNRADLVVADGMPVVALSRLLKRRTLPERITGHDLLHIAASLAARHGYTIAFLGAGPGVAEEAASVLREMHPDLNPVTTYQGSFSSDGRGLNEQDDAGLVNALNLLHPHFLFVALGCPKQELWIARHLHDLAVPVCVGIGGVLDVLAGRFKRAPSWIQRAGLEWSYRLAQEPRRLWRRYLLNDLGTLSRLGVFVVSTRGRSIGRSTT